MIQQFNIKKCKLCGQEHSFQILVEKKTPVFGGATPEASSTIETEWTFTCPNTNDLFSTKVPLPKGLKMKGIVENDTEQHSLPMSCNDEIIKSEYETWVNDSRKRALSFSTTMLTTSTGAIGILFAILKYLGVEKISDHPYSNYAFAPSIFYLAASVFFVFALTPKFDSIAPSDFEDFRANILWKFNIYNTLGLYSFLIGNILAVLSFVFILNK